MSIFHDKYFLEILHGLSKLINMPMCICDEEFNLVPDIPIATATTFCHTLQTKYPDFLKKCIECDAEACKRCKKTKTFTLYRCHAGLIEATTPIMADGNIVGYVMFGQTTDIPDQEKFTEIVVEKCKKYAPVEELRELSKGVKYTDHETLNAAAQILEVCANYIQLKDLVRPSELQLVDCIDKFIDDHLSEDISVERLCHEFNASRTKLYAIANKHLSVGLAAFIKEKRLLAARDLLVSCDTPITEIAEKVGFLDYNYFSKAFKKHFGMSPHQLRKEN